MYNLFTGLCDFLSALKSHCKADTETAPSNAPALNGMPSPMSERIRSPSVSLSIATSENKINKIWSKLCLKLQLCDIIFFIDSFFYLPSIAGEISIPIHMCPFSSSTVPDKPEPHPISSSRQGVSSGRRSSSMHLSVIWAWMSIIRVLESEWWM